VDETWKTGARVTDAQRNAAKNRSGAKSLERHPIDARKSDARANDAASNKSASGSQCDPSV